jgi:hypothetical protein
LGTRWIIRWSLEKSPRDDATTQGQFLPHCEAFFRAVRRTRCPTLGSGSSSTPIRKRCQGFTPMEANVNLAAVEGFSGRPPHDTLRQMTIVTSRRLVVALALAGAPISSLLAASPGAGPAAGGGAGGGGPVGGVAVGVTPRAAAASIKRPYRKPQHHHVAAPQGTRQPVVRSKNPVVQSH